MSSPIFHCEDTAPQLPKGPISYSDDGLNDSLDGSSTELTDVFEEECFEDDLWTPPNDDLKEKIATRLENYLSDQNLSEDAFLLKHVQRNKMGYVSLKLLTSFKKIKDLTRDWRSTLAAARTSEHLEVNETGTKVRRRTLVPDWLLCIPTSKLLLAWNFLDGVSPVKDGMSGSPGLEHIGIMEAAMREFSPFGTISSLRILRPGKEIPAELKRYCKKHMELGRKVCAVVEYEYLEGARKAYESLKAEEQMQGGRGICVALLGSRGTRKPGWSQSLAEDEYEEHIDNDSLKKPSRKSRKFFYSLEDSALCSSSESDFAPASPRPNRRVSRPQALYGSPLAIPRISTFQSDPYRNPLGSPVGSPLQPRKLFPCSHVSSTLATHHFCSTPTAPVNTSLSRCKNSGEHSPDDTGFMGSPWVQKRKHAAQVIQPEMGSSVSPKHLTKSLSVLVVRQPVGPDGTRGFHNCIGRGRMLLP
ncbi:La-related protein 6 [Triplophysa tibetana]|uniref:La-related protein 6 n=1 Tax=Triplophysa tibetana TaxID=1572043 RepID=A0A5A9NFT4_9TELE|nr:La-related protein 6 [Triplophysa tibetana]